MCCKEEMNPGKWKQIKCKKKKKGKVVPVLN
jgi:hypothetical protein